MINCAYAVPVTSQDNGRENPRRSIELLWGTAERPRRGPKPKLTIDRITRVAIELADAEGLAAVSMRRVGELLGTSGMSLYTYLPGKAELLDLMVDAVHAEVPPPDGGVPVPDGWRSRLEAVARRNWELHLRHPWLLRAATVLGPHTMTTYEHDLRAVDGCGLTALETDLVIAVLTSYVHGSVRSAVEPARVEPVRDEPVRVVLAEVFDPERFPAVAAVWAASSRELGAAGDPARAFAFGLALILDGLAGLIDRRSGG